MGVRDLAEEVREEANIDNQTVHEVGFLIVGGWLGGLSWNIAAANMPTWKRILFTVIAFILGLFFLIGLEISSAVGAVVNDRLASSKE